MDRQPKLSTEKQQKLSTRRKFLSGLGSGVVMAFAGKSLLDKKVPTDEKLAQPEITDHNPDIAPALEAQSVTEKRAEGFVDEVRGYACLLPLRFDEVQFHLESGAPLGEPIKLSDIAVDPGPLNEQGIPVDGISGIWLTAARRFLKQEHPEIDIDVDNGIPEQYNVVAQFRAALKDGEDEPDLVALIQSGNITRYIDIVNYFAHKPVKGASEFTRFEYVQNKIAFDHIVPSTIQQELRKMIPALCVQESGFNNGVTSSAGARGIFQFMPGTWEKYSAEPLESASLKTQVEVAGQFFSDLYKQVVHWCGEEALQYLAVQCESHQSFEVEVIVPLMINAYNAGAKRMGDAVKEFVRIQKEENTMLLANKPFDLFASIADLADTSEEGTLAAYSEHARQYVPRIYGHALALQGLQAERVASN